jgi:RNA polymerase sigma-70 factor, ECF subfamily
MPGAKLSDHALLHRFLERQLDAPTHLYRRYAKRLRAAVARQCSPALSPRIDPDDVVQAVFCDFFRGAAEGRYQVPEGRHAWRLLLAMAANRIRGVGDFHRAGRRDVRRTAGGDIYDQALALEFVPDESRLTTLRMAIEDVLRTMPERHRSIIEMRVEGYEVAEIAKRVHVSKRTVERVLQKFGQSLTVQIRESA